MSKEEVEFEDEVIAYLNQNGKMRRSHLIEELIETHTETNKTGHRSVDSGYSTPTLNRKLKAMIKSKKILSLGYEELQKYGFSEIDKNATVLFTKDGLQLKLHIDEMLVLLSSDDELDKQMALKEINRYETMYSFDESQLDMLVKNLGLDNPELINRFLVTLSDYAINKGKEPQDKETLLQALRNVLDKYGEPSGKSGHIRNVALCLLSYYKDESIIDQIIKDATTLANPLDAEDDYHPVYIAEIVVNNPTRLFHLERDLMKEGKRDPAQFVSNIRYKCMDQLGMIDHSKQEEAKTLFAEAEKKYDEENPS